jgi:DNA-binding transcriptional LysR family regulator
LDIPWDDLQLFLAVADSRSINAAARKLRLTQPTLSRRIAALEERLDQPLFVRKTTGVALTPAAERLHAPARRMAEWASEATRAVADRGARPRGRVRLAAPPGVAFDFVIPLAARLRAQNPGISLEVLAHVEYLSLSRGEADLAIRFRPPAASETELVVLAKVPTVAAAFVSPSYARRLPKKYGVADLDWVAWAPPYSELPPNPQLAAVIPDFQPVFSSNDYLVQIAAVHAGIGAMILSEAFHADSRVTDLRRLNLDFGEAGRSVLYVVAAKRMLDVARFRDVAEAIARQLGRSG